MGNWSPYSEEWEKQHVKKVLMETEAARIEFQKKPWIYQALARFLETIRYYGSLLVIHFRRIFDRKYREEMDRAVDGLEEKTLKFFVDMVNEDKDE